MTERRSTDRRSSGRPRPSRRSRPCEKVGGKGGPCPHVGRLRHRGDAGRIIGGGGGGCDDDGRRQRLPVPQGHHVRDESTEVEWARLDDEKEYRPRTAVIIIVFVLVQFRS